MTAVALASTVLASLGLLAVAGGVAGAQGGGIDAAVVRTGTATGVVCAPRPESLGLDWRCSAQVAWQGTAQAPARVELQQAPYEILASTDLSGRTTQVTGHLPMGWQSAGSWRGGFPVEVVVADGHPVGSTLWWALQVWSPLVVIALVLAVALIVYLLYDRYQLSRRVRGRKR